MYGENTSDSFESGIDGGIDKALAAGGTYNAAQNMGAAAASAGQAAAQSAAATGTGAAASAGTGAAVGSAAGPGGTAAGAAIGLAVSLFAKPVIKGLIVIVIALIMIFSSLPSMIFENPADVADKTGPTAVYAEFKQYAMEKYTEEIETRKEEIEAAFQARVDAGEFDEYDDVEFTYSFNPAEDMFKTRLSEASTLIIAMFEVIADDWRKATLDDFKNALDSAGLWPGTVAAAYVDEESEVTYEDTDDDEDESTIHVHINYNLLDKSVEIFRSKFNLTDEKEYIKSVEMAYNIKIFFGEADGMPMGGVTGGASGSYPGGGTHNTIRQALAGLDEPREFFGGPAIIPLQSYSSITSEFGPRNYAPDPLHTGIDFAAAFRTPIYSAMDGIVLLCLTSAGAFGHHIVIYHGGGITTMYAHMSSFGSYQVGDSVSSGDVIGYVGSTGLSEGDHLHFEYQIDGSAHNPRLLLPL